MSLNGKALTAIGIGSIFIWSGVKGWSVLGTVKDLITGHPPASGLSNPLVLQSFGATDSSGGRDENSSPLLGMASIAQTASHYVGHAYRFGGAPGLQGLNPWDCSSFVNWLIGTKLGKAIPGYGPGKYDGSVHGPPTGLWGIWYAGLTSVSRQSVQGGDIIVWTDHMGIALDNGHMISALNPAEGTKVTPIDGYGNGPLMIYGRLKG